MALSPYTRGDAGRLTGGPELGPLPGGPPVERTWGPIAYTTLAASESALAEFSSPGEPQFGADSPDAGEALGNRLSRSPQASSS